MLFGDQLSQYNSTTGKDIEQWNSFVDRHFASPDGRFLHHLLDGDDKRSKQFEIKRHSLARYFWTFFESGASSIRLHTENVQDNPLPTGRHQVMCSTALFTITYPQGVALEMTGALSVHFPPASDMIEVLEFRTSSIEEKISRSEIERVLSNWSPPTANTKSPKMNKKNLPKAQQKLQEQLANLTIDHFPKAPITSMGITQRVQEFLEVCDPKPPPAPVPVSAPAQAPAPAPAQQAPMSTMPPQMQAALPMPVLAPTDEVELPSAGLDMNLDMGMMDMDAVDLGTEYPDWFNS